MAFGDIVDTIHPRYFYLVVFSTSAPLHVRLNISFSSSIFLHLDGGTP